MRERWKEEVLIAMERIMILTRNGSNSDSENISSEIIAIIESKINNNLINKARCVRLCVNSLCIQ